MHLVVHHLQHYEMNRKQVQLIVNIANQVLVLHMHYHNIHQYQDKENSTISTPPDGPPYIGGMNNNTHSSANGSTTLYGNSSDDNLKANINTERFASESDGDVDTDNERKDSLRSTNETHDEMKSRSTNLDHDSNGNNDNDDMERYPEKTRTAPTIGAARKLSYGINTFLTFCKDTLETPEIIRETLKSVIYVACYGYYHQFRMQFGMDFDDEPMGLVTRSDNVHNNPIKLPLKPELETLIACRAEIDAPKIDEHLNISLQLKDDKNISKKTLLEYNYLTCI